jgi:predicted amidohydrolase
LSLILTIAVGNKTDLVVFTKRLADVFDTDGVSTSVVDCELLLLLLMIRSGRGNACYARAKSYDE